ncbi:hypothetical protein [Corynebacterium aquilae]|uniref:Uncharacterized protein n=1 Tax=Corynebacterium aquilae DSM 44791 TaxID=1431546 RepID=A0A1L7CHD5_9CORY|nr:hypothetical protein [Corynebacterium aquilae]APT85280.1 hypothetical protein CAQU_09590 [Corynebacterium aquilae DSM 44791]
MITVIDSKQSLLAMLQRAVKLDEQCAVRARNFPAPTPTVEVFVTTPFEVFAARRCQGSAQPDQVVVAARALAEKLASTVEEAAPTMLAAGGAALWPGALPPVEGFSWVDDVPVSVLRELANQGAAAAQEVKSVGVPTSLLNQTVLTVDGVEIGMRLVWAARQLGFLPLEGAQLPAAATTARVSAAGSWVRVDTWLGSVYQRSGGPLSLTPLG